MQKQASLINVFYANQEVFWLHNEDLRFCDQIMHTIQMMIDVYEYLHTDMIPHRLQGEVWQSFDTCLGLGVIRPLSPVVILWKQFWKSAYALIIRT